MKSFGRLSVQLGLLLCLGLTLVAAIDNEQKVEAVQEELIKSTEANHGSVLAIPDEGQKGENFVLVADDENEDEQQEPKPKLWDFTKYKMLFHKSYGSIAEDLRRSKLFMMRSINVAKAYIAHKLGKSKSYLGLNRMSDWTPEERARLKTHYRGSGSKLSGTMMSPRTKTKTDENGQEGRGDGSDANQHASVEEHKRTKRSVDESGPSKTSQYDRKLVSALKNNVKKLLPSSARNDGIVSEKGIDLRKTGCFTTPIHQGECGSCYAVATIAMYEYLYCRIHGKKAKFSTQFVIDCGRGYDMSGCDGGVMTAIVEFAADKGFNLASEYPYIGEQGTCRSKEGFIKASPAAGYEQTSIDMWSHWLRRSVPIYASIGYGNSFLDYYSGVDMGECHDGEGHAVVVVGEGNKNGEDYWLMRNSFGSDWGYNGYYKMSKKTQCIMRGGESYVLGGHQMRNSRAAFVDPKVRDKKEPKEVNRETKNESKQKPAQSPSPTAPYHPVPPAAADPPPSSDYGSTSDRGSSYSYNDYGGYQPEIKPIDYGLVDPPKVQYNYDIRESFNYGSPEYSYSQYQPAGDGLNYEYRTVQDSWGGNAYEDRYVPPPNPSELRHIPFFG